MSPRAMPRNAMDPVLAYARHLLGVVRAAEGHLVTMPPGGRYERHKALWEAEYALELLMAMHERTTCPMRDLLVVNRLAVEALNSVLREIGGEADSVAMYAWDEKVLTP